MKHERPGQAFVMSYCRGRSGYEQLLKLATK